MNNINSINELIPYIEQYIKFKDFTAKRSKEPENSGKIIYEEPIYFKYNNQDYVICSKEIINSLKDCYYLQQTATINILFSKDEYFFEIKYSDEVKKDKVIYSYQLTILSNLDHSYIVCKYKDTEVVLMLLENCKICEYLLNIKNDMVCINNMRQEIYEEHSRNKDDNNIFKNLEIGGRKFLIHMYVYNTYKELIENNTEGQKQLLQFFIDLEKNEYPDMYKMIYDNKDKQQRESRFGVGRILHNCYIIVVRLLNGGDIFPVILRIQQFNII